MIDAGEDREPRALDHGDEDEIARKAGHIPLGTFDRALGKQSGAERI